MANYRECINQAARTPQAWIIAVAVSIVVGTFLGAGVLLPLLDRPPTTVLPPSVVSNTIKEGGYLELVRHATASRRGRTCPGSIVWEFHRQIELKGEKVWQKWRKPLSGSPIEIDGEEEWTTVIELLPGMKTGHWRLLGENTYNCWLVFGGTFKYRISPVEFDIIPADAK